MYSSSIGYNTNTVIQPGSNRKSYSGRDSISVHSASNNLRRLSQIRNKRRLSTKTNDNSIISNQQQLFFTPKTHRSKQDQEEVDLQLKANEEIHLKSQEKLNTSFIFRFDLRLMINISGKRFEVEEKLLNKYPTTLLGCEQKRSKYYDPLRNEYFFDRNREAFENILFFYQSNGKFHVPYFLHVEVFFDEIKFFQLQHFINCESECDEALQILALEDELTEIKLRECELKNIQNNESNSLDKEKLELRDRFKHLKYFNEELEDLNERLSMPKNKVQQYIWLLFERPQTSFFGRVVAFVCLATVIVSVFTMCMETVVDSYGLKYTSPCEDACSYAPDHYFSSEQQSNKFDENYDILNQEEERKPLFFVLELICNSIFTLEISFRLISSSQKVKFLKNFSNIVDIIAIVPFWTTLILNNTNTIHAKLLYLFIEIKGEDASSIQSQLIKKSSNNDQYGLSVLRILRLVRILRIFKLSRHIRALNIMGKILYECLYEIVLLLTFLGINVVIFSSFIYYIEFYALGELSPFLSDFDFF
jgi:potassium voltage-gated channel Shaker-related subfamily A protein 4